MVFARLYSPPREKINTHIDEKSLPAASSTPLLTRQGDIFFHHLWQQIEKDLLFLKQKKEDVQNLIFKHIFLQKGVIQDKDDNDQKREVSYLFLQTMGAPGLLLQRFPKSVSLLLYHATKVRTVVKNDLNELVSPEMFVLKSDVVEEFCFLDEAYVRTKGSDKTLSLEQMSETLLLLIASRTL